jgi:hypothetical protein
VPKSEVWVFCNREKGGLWYRLNSQGESINIEAPCLTGYIRRLEFTKPLRRGKETDKLNCIVESDNRYVLESGALVQFSKGLLNAIASMSEEQLSRPVSLVPEASTKNEEVLFCNVYQDEKQIFAPYDEGTEWKPVCRMALDKIKVLNPQEYQKSE